MILVPLVVVVVVVVAVVVASLFEMGVCNFPRSSAILAVVVLFFLDSFFLISVVGIYLS